MTNWFPDGVVPQHAAVSGRTILVVDDHRLFADMLCAAWHSVEGLTCVAIAESSAEGIALVAQLRPSIVLMDIQMPEQDGLIATRRIREVAPDTLIAVITAHRDQQWISLAAQAGASAFVPKNGSLQELLEILQQVERGRLIVRPRPTAQVRS